MEANIKALLEQEKALEAARKDLVSRFTDEVRDAVLDCVTPIPNEGGLAVYTVNASALAGGKNLSPEYYIQSKQADLVASRLGPAKDLGDVRARLEEMVDKKSVSITGVCMGLNDNTVHMLESFLAEFNRQEIREETEEEIEEER